MKLSSCEEDESSDALRGIVCCLYNIMQFCTRPNNSEHIGNIREHREQTENIGEHREHREL